MTGQQFYGQLWTILEPNQFTIFGADLYINK